MRKIKPYFTYLLACCLLGVIFSFTIQQSRKLDPKSYTQWVLNPKNGLQSKSAVGPYDFIINYLPSEYMILKEANGRTMDRKEFSRKRQELKNTEYYSLLINLNNGKKNVVKSLVDDTKIPASDMVKYLAYDLQHDIKLVSGVDTLKCKFLHFEETYEVTSYARFLAAFDVSDDDKKNHRILQVSLPWMKERILTFTIEKENILSVPKVSVKK